VKEKRERTSEELKCPPYFVADVHGDFIAQTRGSLNHLMTIHDKIRQDQSLVLQNMILFYTGNEKIQYFTHCLFRRYR